MSEAAAQAEDAKVADLIARLRLQHTALTISLGRTAGKLKKDSPFYALARLIGEAADLIAALRADAERLDFLQKHNACIEPVVGNIMPAGSFAVWWCEDHEPDMGKDLRAAIDTARRIAARREGS